MMWKSPFIYLEHCRERYGGRFTVNATSHPPLVFLSDRDEIGEVLAAPADVLHPGDGAASVKPIVGDESFMLLDETAHVVGRRSILPPLQPGAVAKHAETMREATQREIASWPRGVPFALHPRLRALALQTALRTVLGVAEHLGDGRVVELQERLLAMFTVTGSAVFPEPLLRHGPGRQIWRRFLRERLEIDHLLYELIRRREDGADGGADNVLDRLLAARNTDGSQMSSKQVRDNLMSIILAGHETTAAQLAWAFQLLAHDPIAQDTLAGEIDSDRGEEYLTASIREVLRHRPVFLFAIPRTVKQPIDIGGRTYGPPAQLLGCIYLMHHDARFYPEPQKFRPERFLQVSPATGAWRPWGGGRKRCPGLHLATLEMKVVLRTVLTSMTVRPAARDIERPRWRSVIVTPAAGSRVVLRRRSKGSDGRRRASHGAESGTGLGGGVIAPVGPRPA
jgi:cytochrome P450